MPQYIEIVTNKKVIFGQHFKKKSLIPGKALYSDGICHGLSLAWIKKIHTLKTFCQISLPSSNEGLLIQNKLDYNFNTRKHAIKKENYKYDEHYNELVSPDKFFVNDNYYFLKSYSELGFKLVKYCGLMSAFRLTYFLNDLLKNNDMRTKIKAYLICTGGHALALAINYKSIVFFDSNYGIIIYNHKEAIDDALLFYKFNECLLDYKIKQLAVVELQY
jgi:hypothetical protein